MLWRKSNWLQVNSEVTVRLAGYRAVYQTWRKGFAWSVLLHQLYQVALGLAKACVLYMSVALIHTSGGCQLRGLTGAQGHSLVLAVICGSDSPKGPGPTGRVSHPVLALDLLLCLWVHGKPLKPSEVQPCLCWPVCLLSRGNNIITLTPLIFMLLRHKYLLKMVLCLLFLLCYSSTVRSEKNPFCVHFLPIITQSQSSLTYICLFLYSSTFIWTPRGAVCNQWTTSRAVNSKAAVHQRKQENRFPFTFTFKQEFAWNEWMFI